MRLLKKKVPVSDFVGTVPSAKKYCFNQNRQWRHFIVMTAPMSLKPYDKFSSTVNARISA